MTRTVVVDRPSGGNDAWLSGDPARWLPEPTYWRGGDRWSLVLRAGPVSQEVVCHVGEVWRQVPWAARRLGWEPAPEPNALLPADVLLPSLNGELRWRPDGDEGLVLQIVGRYTPPGALPGRLLDEAGLHRVALGTLRHLLDGIAARAPAVAAD